MHIEAKQGIWEITNGKGDRCYIKCTNERPEINPEQMLGMNGVLIYGYENLQDLAIAILKFEKMKQHHESINGRLDVLNSIENPPTSNE